MTTKYEEITTARECRAQASKQFGPLVAELVVKATAPARISWRESETLRAAGEGENPASTGYRARCAARLRIDIAGVGGILDAEGRGTDRMPQFRSLGTGRWQASDGEAWRAAAEGALGGLMRDGGVSYLAIELRGNRVVLVDSQGAACGHFAGLAPLRWLRAEATRAALHLAGVGDWEPALSWSDEAIEAALTECRWIEADETRAAWLAQAELWHQAEFAAWSAQDGDDSAEQAALEAAMGSSMPEGGGWP